MDISINAPGHGNNIVDGINATKKCYLRGEMELIGKLGSNDTTKIGILPSVSKYVFIKFSDQYIYIIDNKYRLNGLKSSTKIQKRESLFKYQSCLYNAQRDSDVNHRCMIIIWNNKPFP